MKKRILAALLSAALTACCLPVAAASDIDGHWAEQYITYLNEEGVINPSATTGDYSPNEKVMRAEFMRYINRAFHFTETTSISYTDVSASDWYYETVQIAEKYGYIAGVGDGKMDPEGYITREQAATIIGRLYKTTVADAVTPDQLTFSDKNEVSDWSAGYIYDAVQKGYIVGYPDGTFKPKNTVTRAEIARILYSYLGNSLSSVDGNYTAADFRSDVENVTISESCTLSDAEVGGDLYITEGVGTEQVILNDLVVDGALVISGGNVTLNNVDAPVVVIGSSMNRLIQVNATGGTNLANTEVQSTANLTEAALNVSAGGFSDITLNGSESTVLTLSSDVWDLDMLSNSTVSLASDARINTLTLHSGGTVSGYGVIDAANILASGATLSITPSTYTLASGVSATINGQTVKAETDVAVTPSSFSYDKGSSNLENSYDFQLSVDPSTLRQVTLEGSALVEGTDYRITEDGLRLYRTFLTSIEDAGTYILELSFSDNGKGRLTLEVADSSKSTIAPSQATYDKYTGADVEFILTAASGSQLSSVKISGTTLTRGEDYTYNSATGSVVLLASYLNTRATGTSTITFTMSNGNSLTASLSVVDTTPVNALSSTELDFDANASSSEYGDLQVTLTPVNNAELTSITAVGADRDLDEGWQYTIDSDGLVSINRAALSELAADGRSYIDLRFNMSSGVNPVLRVNFVTTYQVRVNVLDDLGQAVRDASVRIEPDASSQEDNTDATPAQEKLTDSTGNANFFVKKGAYTITITSDRFETITRAVRVGSGNQTVNITAEIKEEVTIAVTAPSGANISGATVVLGDQTQTTGEDGTATFEIAHGIHPLRVTASGYTTYTNDTFQVTTSTTYRVAMSR